MLKYKSLHNLIYALFSILFFFLPFSSASIEIVFALISFLFLLYFILNKNYKLNFLNIVNDKWFVLSLIAWFLLLPSAFFNPDLRSASLEACVTKWGEGFFFFLFSYYIFSRKKPHKVVCTILISASIVIFDAFFQKFIGTDPIRGRALAMGDVGNLNAITGPFSHYNALGSYITPVLFLTLAMFFFSEKKKIRLALIVFGFLGLIALLFTFSRSAWLAFVVTLLFSLFFVKRGNRIKVTAILVLFFIVMLCIPELRNRFIYSFGNAGDSDRFRIWGIALKMFFENPIYGKGLGTFMTRVTDYALIFPVYAHNCYLQLLAETGLLGFSGFMILIVSFLVSGFRFMHRFKDDLFFRFLFLSLVSFLIVSFFDVQFYSLQLSMFFWALLGMAVGYMKLNETKNV